MRALIIALGASAIAAGAAQAQRPPTPAPPLSDFLRGPPVIFGGRAGSGSCLDIRASDSVALLWSCHGGANQQFRFRTGSYGQIMVGNRCLSTSGGEGAPLVAAPCRNTTAQRWAIRDNGRLNNEQGWCADVEREGGQGSRVIGYRCTDRFNQRWTMSNLSPFRQGVVFPRDGVVITCNDQSCLPVRPPFEECIRSPNRCFFVNPVHGYRTLMR